MREYRPKFRFRLNSRQRQFLRDAGKFALTVVASAVLSVWLGRELDKPQSHQFFGARHFLTSLKIPTWSGVRFASDTMTARLGLPLPAKRGTGSLGSGSLIDQYSRHFSDSLPKLRANARVKMVKLSFEPLLLKYQQNPPRQGADLKLVSKAVRIPVLAVSRNAQELLEDLRIPYIDGQIASEDALDTAEPRLEEKVLRGALLVPDVSGNQAKLFQLVPNR